MNMIKFFQKKNIPISGPFQYSQKEAEIKEEIKYLKKEQDMLFPKAKWYHSLSLVCSFTVKNTSYSKPSSYKLEKFDSLSTRINLLREQLEELQKNFPDGVKTNKFN